MLSRLRMSKLTLHRSLLHIHFDLLCRFCRDHSLRDHHRTRHRDRHRSWTCWRPLSIWVRACKAERGEGYGSEMLRSVSIESQNFKSDKRICRARRWGGVNVEKSESCGCVVQSLKEQSFVGPTRAWTFFPSASVCPANCQAPSHFFFFSSQPLGYASTKLASTRVLGWVFGLSVSFVAFCLCNETHVSYPTTPTSRF